MTHNAKIDIQACRELRRQEEALVNHIRAEIHQAEPNALIAYLPNLMPASKVDYIVLAMEPSMAWAKSEAEADQKVRAGYRNFMHSWEDFLLHFSLKHYLPNYHITDVSKVAMTVDNAGKWRADLYPKWLELLKQEIKLVGHSTSQIIPLGNKVAEYLEGVELPCQIAPKMMHFSQTAARWRSKIPHQYPEEFDTFAATISKELLLQSAQERFISLFEIENQIFETAVPKALIRARIEALKEKEPDSLSRKYLLFTYKKHLEGLKA